MVSYSANAEDVVLHRALCRDGVGRYVDVGASSPYVSSVTRHFYDAGWSGIDIEPLAEEAAELRKARPRDVVVEAALGIARGEITLYVVDDERGLSSTDAEVGESYVRVGREVRERLVELRTLSDVLEEHNAGDISFLKVDVEGAEAEVLSGNDWTRWRPRVVVVESTYPWSHQQTQGAWEPLLLAAGYVFASFDGLNRYYARSEERDLLPLLAPASVLDDFVPENVARTECYVEELEAELAHQVSRAAQLESYVSSLKAEMADQVSRAAELESYVSSLKAEMADQVSHAAELESYVTGLKAELADQVSHAAELESYVTGLKAELAAQVDQVAEIGAHVGHVEEEIRAKDRFIGELESLLSPALDIQEDVEEGG